MTEFYFAFLESVRIFLRRIKIIFKGTRKYNGDAELICNEIIYECWNGKYFKTSAGHFSGFYIRDFGWVVKSLIELGHKDKVRKTLEYALRTYSNQRLTTTITPGGFCLDIFDYSPDSLAYLLYSLRISENEDLSLTYKNFINKEVKRFYGKVINKKTGLVKKDKYFSSSRDAFIRSGSCYDNTMIAVISKELEHLKFENPFRKDVDELIIKEYWSGEYFYDDYHKHKGVVADSNIFPFWLEVINKKELKEKALNSLVKEKLDHPFPIKYSKEKYDKEIFWVKIFAPKYQTTTTWSHIGILFIGLLADIDRKKSQEHFDKYTEVIEKNKNFFETFNEKGGIYKTPFYHSAESMIWAANYLSLKKKLDSIVLSPIVIDTNQ